MVSLDLEMTRLPLNEGSRDSPLGQVYWRGEHVGGGYGTGLPGGRTGGSSATLECLEVPSCVFLRFQHLNGRGSGWGGD